MDPDNGRFGLRCWRGVRQGAPDHQTAGDDPAALRAQAHALLAQGAYARIELVAWNIELNDWVRMEWVGGA
jgi:hypothetical protein